MEHANSAPRDADGGVGGTCLPLKMVLRNPASHAPGCLRRFLSLAQMLAPTFLAAFLFSSAGAGASHPGGRRGGGDARAYGPQAAVLRRLRLRRREPAVAGALGGAGTLWMKTAIVAYIGASSMGSALRVRAASAKLPIPTALELGRNRKKWCLHGRLD